MTIAFDAKRAFLNSRGLGNYSRDMLRLASTYAPEHDYLLCSPAPASVGCQPVAGDLLSRTLLPEGGWRLCPSAWRTWGCTDAVVRAGADAYWGLSAELPLNIHHSGLKTIVTVHDAIFLRYPTLYSRSYRLWLTHKVRYACRTADTIIAVSRQTADDCVTLLGAEAKRVRVMYQGCSNIFRTPHSSAALQAMRERYSLPNKYVLYVGAIEPRKNIANLLSAMSGLSDLPLVVVGGVSRYADEMKQMARDKRLNVFFRHDIPFSEFPKLYQSAHVFAYVSLFEGFGIPVLEALCSGVPVVTSLGSCFRETGGESALYADPLDTADIAYKLRQAAYDSALRQQMIAEGHRHAELFNDENIGHNIKQLLDEIETRSK